MLIVKARKILVLFLVTMVGIGTTFPVEANAQRWLQTSQLNVPMESSGPAQALLDTLIQVAERKDSIRVKRSSDSEEMISVSDLKDKLISEAGYALSSASNVFVDYRFTIDSRGFEESIEAFQFLYRSGEGQEDVKMLYVNANEPWVESILRNKGTSLRSNRAALQTFSDQLAFARMHEDGKIVEISGTPVREGFESKKRKLVEKITRLTYESM